MAMMTKNTEFRFTGYHMLACMFAFFGVIIVVNFTMASFASSSWTGLVVKNSYVASQKFNGELARAEAQHARGWRSYVTYQGGKVRFSLLNKSGELITAEQVNLVIGRPAFEQQDQRVELTQGLVGEHFHELQLGDGTWALQIEALADGVAYRRDLRLYVKRGEGTIE